MDERLLRLPFEFDENDKLGSWDVLLSEDAIKDMRQLESASVINAVIKELVHISSGAWDKHGLRDVQSDAAPVYEVKLFDNLTILWQVDCGFSVRSNRFMQLVKIWAVTANQEQVNKKSENISMVYQFCNAAHMHRCTVQQAGNRGIILPKVFDDEEEMVTKYTSEVNMDEEKLLEVHKMLITNKFTPLSKSLLNSLVIGGLEFTFQISKKEYEIITNPTSAIVIGRSGTGKTTCIVYRLIASHLAKRLYKTPSWHANEENVRRRQIFITVSTNLCSRVKEYFNRLQKSVDLAGKKLSEALFNEYIRNKAGNAIAVELINNTMLEEADEENVLGNIPNSFRQLTDDHFPLFITYGKFMKMLQGTYGIDIQKLIPRPDFKDENEPVYRVPSFLKNSKASWAHFVNYNIFQKRYWPHLGDLYRNTLDCSLVYAEFSVIKSSNLEEDYLSRVDYREFSTRKYSVFRYNRDTVYNLFLRYEKMKARNNDYDSNDRALAVLRCARTEDLGDLHIDEVYIDECQDNSVTDFALILKLFNNADNIFVAGDIAQCIAPGSSFRFQDISYLMHKWERERIHQRPLSKRDPKKFELNVNYRSHNGILRLASSVIDLILFFFPDAIDRLSSEHSDVCGPKPVIYKNFLQEKTDLFKIFCAGERIDDKIEFGAEQVIIVRDDEAKQNLRGKIGDAGLVMTVFETKGMEFNDVLLYNFFTDSPACLKWRVVLSALDNYADRTQSFSHEKHYILSSELKNLYVAITRARQHVWIFEEDPGPIHPIQRYWEHHELVKVTYDLNEISTLTTLVKKSNSYDWDRQGKNFFEQQKYDQAMICFRKGGNEERHKLAEAYYLQQRARLHIDSDSDTVRNNFKKAAEAFDKCNRWAQEALCYQDGGMHAEAGKAYSKCKMFDHAADCYFQASMWTAAGDSYKMAKKYSDAIDAYKRCNQYETIINLMKRHRQEISKELLLENVHHVYDHYRLKNEKMKEQTLAILPTQEEQIEFLKTYGLNDLLEFYEGKCMFRDAARLHHSIGKLEDAADMLIRTKSDGDVLEALQCLLHLCRVSILRKTMPDIITSTNNSQVLRDLLSKINRIQQLGSQKLKRSEQWKILTEEIKLYSAYLDGNFGRVDQCIQFFRECKEFIAEFRAISIWLNFQLNLRADYWRQRLQHLLRLVELISPFTKSTRSDEICKDFEQMFCVSTVENRPSWRKTLSDSLLANKLNDKNAESEGEWHIYKSKDVHGTMLQSLVGYIYRLIREVDISSKDIPDIGFPICDRNKLCQGNNCRKHHVYPTPTSLYGRLSLACLQYTVVRQLDVLRENNCLNDGQVLGLQRKWTEKLITLHIRYQSPQTSCPEVTHWVIDELSEHARNGIIGIAYTKWLGVDFKFSDFANMLKCIFVFQQLRDRNGIGKFHEVVSKTPDLNNLLLLPICFEYKGRKIVAVGKRLSLFMQFFYSNKTIHAIRNATTFIDYAISNAESVNIVQLDALGDLVSLMEFATSLVFAARPGYCDSCLPRSYLINYYRDNAYPFFPNQGNQYNTVNYHNAINNAFNQAQQLFHLIYKFQPYSPTVVRLIRLLVLIGLNECTFESPVLKLFTDIRNQYSCVEFRGYVMADNMTYLARILANDLKATGCDSLVIIHNSCGPSRFRGLNIYDVKMLSYNSVAGFYSSLDKIVSRVGKTSVVNKFSQHADEINESDKSIYTACENPAEMDLPQADESDKPIYAACENPAEMDSPQADEAARKIQAWFRQAQKSRKLCYDIIFNKIYNDMLSFCQIVTRENNARSVYKYNILLRGPVVEVIMKLIKLRRRILTIKNELQEAINNYSSDIAEVKRCLEAQKFVDINLAF
ncbi:1680_t:CDS:10 [Paraglomus brasilianum]|uniref:1680_t:CDS:1 n=1 Tax=Paraglomus brasilianum TaxID=144538 RepID=A0A9N9A950_9GLOM|nr:1680_t:CDS:10 [Paraglomus brasilianum]